MGLASFRSSVLSERERQQRRRLLSMTLLTCLVLALIGGTIHVVMLGKLRLGDMRRMATYDLKEESARVRAAGEDLVLQRKHETERAHAQVYSVVEAQRLVGREQWEDLDRMVGIPAGPFIMGTDLERADEQDKPRHEVTVPAFYLDKFLVTNAQYARFVASTQRRAPLNWKDGRIPQGELLKPVTMVTWNDAADYCAWDHRRLPNEAEYEKAGRGTDGRRWPWGDQMDPTRLNTYYNVGSSSNVMAYPRGASIYGAYDLSGNVAEWTADDLRPYEGSKAAQNFPSGNAGASQTGNYKVLRGGSWKGDPFSTSLYHRNFAFPNQATDFYGFRCASSAEPTGREPP
ncbi:MAG: formylglycine-generating enzyme family protein [Steroidobacteraceae bacterium]|jgi:iron(II)-dependent oxidoreductase